jgi:hypothetical protein
MLWGRITYELMESYWPAVARGDVEAPPAIRDWAVKLEAKPKYVVSLTREIFRGPTATTSPMTCEQACKGLRTQLRRACSLVAANSQPSWTGWT